MTATAETITLEKEDQATVKVVYGIYIANLIGILMPTAPFAGIIFAYIFRNDARLYLKSHFDYLTRAFWLMVLYVVLSILLFPVIIGIILLPAAIIWWIVRMAIGIKALIRNQAIVDPKTWLF